MLHDFRFFENLLSRPKNGKSTSHRFIVNVVFVVDRNDVSNLKWQLHVELTFDRRKWWSRFVGEKPNNEILLVRSHLARNLEEIATQTEHILGYNFPLCVVRKNVDRYSFGLKQTTRVVCCKVKKKHWNITSYEFQVNGVKEWLSWNNHR